MDSRKLFEGLPWPGGEVFPIMVRIRRHKGMILRTARSGAFLVLEKGVRVFNAIHEQEFTGTFRHVVSGLEDTIAVVRLDPGFDVEGFNQVHAATDVPVGGPRDVKMNMMNLEEIIEP